jgi:hypothetical protein|tara:strand:- start:58 stop:231 length:174 start_codon:yes stop_codon:yes gene_type:complete
MIGKRFGPPPLKGPVPDGIKYKFPKMRKIPASDLIHSFSNGGVSVKKLLKKWRKKLG